MAKKNLNDRCPLQDECERKCEYKFRELECDYYANNGVGEDRTIQTRRKGATKPSGKPMRSSTKPTSLASRTTTNLRLNPQKA